MEVIVEFIGRIFSLGMLAYLGVYFHGRLEDAGLPVWVQFTTTTLITVSASLMLIALIISVWKIYRRFR